MNIKPARRRVTRDFDLWNAPYEMDVLDRVVSGIIIILACLVLLATCTPAHAAYDQYEADRRADERQAEADRRADERQYRAEAAENLREFERRLELDNRDFQRRYEAIGTERDPYRRRRY
jgi:hypothetical protein